MSGTQDDQVGGPGGSEDNVDGKQAQAASKEEMKAPPPTPKSRALIPDTDDEDDE